MKLEVVVVPVSDVDRAKAFYRSLGWREDIDHEWQVIGPEPNHGDYGSFARFKDPDGNGWVLQEVRKRAPGQ